MGHLYKNGRVWRLTLCRNGVRKDINLGEDFTQAKILKGSIEQAWETDKFKSQLMTTLQTLGLNESPTNNPNPVHASETTPMSIPVVAPAPSTTQNSWETVKQRLIDHLKKIGRKARTIEIALGSLKSLEELLKIQSPADATPEGIDYWIATLLSQPNKNDKSGKKKIKPSYVSLHVRSVKACFRWFLRWKLVSSNPFTGCEMPKCAKSIPKPFTAKDLENLLNACNKPLRRCIEILVHSGMRPDELYHLTWKRVQYGDKPAIIIEEENGWIPKAHMERMIPMTEKLAAALGTPGLSTELVASKNEQGYRIGKDWFERSFKRAIRRVGLEKMGYTPNSCRDTYATNLAIEGYEAHAIAARLGHSNLQTSMRYVSLGRVSMDQKGSHKKMKRN